MTVSPHTLHISIQGIQNKPELQPQDHLIVQVFHNKTKVSLLELTGLQSSCLLSEISPNDIVQIVLMEHHKQDWFGSVSFLMDSFLECTQRKFSQWITLSKDFSDDLFDSNFPNNDKQAPRLRLCFDFSGIALPQSEKISEVDTIPSRPGKNEKEYFEPSMSEYGMSDESEKAQIRILTDEGLDDKCLTLRIEAEDKITAHLKMLKGSSFKEIIHSPLSFKLPSGLISARGNSPFRTKESTRRHFIPKLDELNQTDGTSIDLDESSVSLNINIHSPEESKNPVTALKKELANDFKVLGAKLKQAGTLARDAKELKEILTRRDSDGFDIDQEGQTDKSETTEEQENALQHENGELHLKLKEARDRIQTLEDENVALRKNEKAYTEKLNKVNIELENLNVGAVGHENLVNELQAELVALQDQVKDETQLRIQIQKENETLNGALNMLRKQYDKIIIKEKQLRQSTKENSVDIESHQMLPRSLNELNGTQIKSETTIKCQQPDQKVEELDVVIQGSVPITPRTEEEQPAAASLIDVLDSAREHTKESQPQKIKEVESYSKTDKLVLESLMSQIKHLQSYVKSLETEKEDLKDELFKANENYSVLTTKYIELTEVLAGGAVEEKETTRPSVGRYQNIRTDRDLVTPRNMYTPRSIVTPRETQNTQYTEADEDDEVQVKFKEFLTVNKISPSSFIRLDKNIYMYNEKKITLKVLHKRLIAKVNGNFQTMDEFWRAYNKGKERMKTPPPLTKLTPNTVRSHCTTPEKRNSQSISRLGAKRTSEKRDRLDSARSEILPELFDMIGQNENLRTKEAAILMSAEKKRKIYSSNLKERLKKI